MNTLLISEVFPPQVGGSGRWLWETFRRFPREKVAVVAGEYPGAAEFDRGHDRRVTRMPLGFPTWGVVGWQAAGRYWGRFRQVRRIARRERAEAVVAARLLPEGLIALALHQWAGLPYTCFAYGEELNYTAGSRELTFLARRVLARCRQLICCSRASVRLLTDQWGVPAEKVHLLYPGVDARTYVPAARDPGARADLGWGDRPVVFTAGRLQRRKGQDTMIRALPAVCRRVPNVLYAIAGDGEERPYLEALARELGVVDSVQFLGEVADDTLVRCYQQCDLFALPNRQVGQDIEGFGIVLVEAQACGKPVIAGTSGGTAETMRVPDTGLVVPCETPGPLADAVAGLLADPGRRARMGHAARAWAVEQFDWESLTARAAGLLGLTVREPVGMGA